MRLLIGILLFIVITLAILTMKDSSRIKNLHKLHPRLTVGDSIAGRVNKLHVEKGATFITIGRESYFIHTAANYLYLENHFSKIVTIGDSVIKQSGNDTIFLYKNNRKFIFVNDKRINR